MDELRKAAEALIGAWDRWCETPALMPSGELCDAIEEQREALRITDGWQIIPATTPNLTAAEYASAYLGLPIDYWPADRPRPEVRHA